MFAKMLPLAKSQEPQICIVVIAKTLPDQQVSLLDSMLVEQQ